MLVACEEERKMLKMYHQCEREEIINYYGDIFMAVLVRFVLDSFVCLITVNEKE